jgi:NagD protein
VIGEAGITTALHEAGFIMTETAPDAVGLPARLLQLLLRGDNKRHPSYQCRIALHCDESDATGPSADGPLLATGRRCPHHQGHRQ